MRTALVIAWAFFALLLVSDGKATAQVVIGGPGGSDVQVNQQVLQALGPPPTLAALLRGPVAPTTVQTQPASQFAAPSQGSQGGGEGIVFHRYVPPHHSVRLRHPKTAHRRPVRVKIARNAPERAKHHAPPAGKVAHIETPAHKVAAAPHAATKKASKPAVKMASKPVVKEAAEPKPESNKPKIPVVAAVSKPVPAVKPAPVQPTSSPASPKIVANIVTKAPQPVPPSKPVVPATATAPASSVVMHKDGTLTVLFPTGSATVPAGADSDLKALALRMKANQDMSLQLVAYAKGSANDVSRARRLSLSRALEVRRYLMAQGVDSTRVDIQALGNMVRGGGSPDRVDAIPTAR